MKIAASKYRLFKAAAIYSSEFLDLSGAERSVFVTMLNNADDDGVLNHLDCFIRKTKTPLALLRKLEDRNMITLLTWNSYIINEYSKYVYIEYDQKREMWDTEIPPMENINFNLMQIDFSY